MLHADSNFSNIMIKYEGDQVRGYLIDWDLSKEVNVRPEDDPIGKVVCPSSSLF